MTYDTIMDRIQSDYAYLEKCCGYEVVGVFLLGSQNYNCSTDNSDIDTKAIIIPTIDQMIMGNIKITQTIERDNGEITVFDIKSMHDSIKKMNINFLEILFTKYYHINPKYEMLWGRMRSNNIAISRMNEYAAVQCINGCIINKLKKVFHSVPSNFEKINKYGYDNKALADVIRLTDFMERYINNYSYNDCLVTSDDKIDFILSIKDGNSGIDVNTAHNFADACKDLADTLLNMYKESHEEIVDYDVLTLIDNVTTSCCRKYIKERFGLEHWPD